ncbi:MAG: hypothetical protein PHV28_15635 [Kiritimatiellae bacterium]|nr:hypothetical protein [Kiritimatiellia bacterium]
MTKSVARTGFILPVVVACMLVVGVVAGGLLSYILSGTRSAGYFVTASQCRFAAQTALDRAKVQISDAFKQYNRALRTSYNVLGWFDSFSGQSIGTGGYVANLMQGGDVNGYTVTVSIQGVDRSTAAEATQYARVTLHATATGKTASGIEVSRTIEETVEYALRRSSVFDYAYFVNNYGYFQGNGVTANGDIRSNGNMNLDRASYINGNAYASPNSELGVPGLITVSGGGSTRHLTLSQYWSGAGTSARPASPASVGGALWEMGYEGTSDLYSYQEPLDMPFLGDLAEYRTVASNLGGTIKQNGKTLVDGCYSGKGPSGVAGAVDTGCLVLDGTSKPIEISGPVVVNGDVVIKGTVKGQGVIYAGRNIHIVGDVIYNNAPAWPKPDTKPDKTIKSNESADMLGLAAKGNIVVGNYTDSGWLDNTLKNALTVEPYTCDATDASIGYPATFNGNYLATDSGKKVNYVYDYATGKYKASGSSNRRYYESSVGDQIIKTAAQKTAIDQIDAVLYNNHAVMGHVGEFQLNGSMVCRDDALVYSTSVQLNWDSRLGSRSSDGREFFIYLPMSVAMPRVISWRELL